MSPQPIRVTIIEDDLDTRDTLLAVVKSAGRLHCPAVYSRCEDALQKISKDKPDVILMDINLPGMNGIQGASEAKTLRPDVQILMLTVFEDSRKIFAALRAGASGYLTKNTPADEIIEAIEQVNAGGSPMSMNIARKLVGYFQQLKPLSAECQLLTPREDEVISLLAKGCLYKEIADRLGITTGTVRVHLHSIYEKLHVSTRTEAVIKFLASHPG